MAEANPALCAFAPFSVFPEIFSVLLVPASFASASISLLLDLCEGREVEGEPKQSLFFPGFERNFEWGNPNPFGLI